MSDQPVAPRPMPEDSFLTPTAVILEEAQAYGGLDKIRFQQRWIHCKNCRVNFPAQVAIGLDLTKLRCPMCGAENSEDVTDQATEETQAQPKPKKKPRVWGKN